MMGVVSAHHDYHEVWKIPLDENMREEAIAEVKKMLILTKENPLPVHGADVREISCRCERWPVLLEKQRS